MGVCYFKVFAELYWGPPQKLLFDVLIGNIKKKLKKKCFVFANFGLKVTCQGYEVGKNEKKSFYVHHSQVYTQIKWHDALIPVLPSK